MSLRKKLENDLNEAVKQRDSFRKDTLRLIRSELKNTEIRLGHHLEDEEIVALLKREVKKRQESVEAYKIAGKDKLANNELKEAELIGQYLPKSLSADEIRQVVVKHLKDNPSSPADSGRVIGELAKVLKGRADMGLVARLVKEALSSS